MKINFKKYVKETINNQDEKMPFHNILKATIKTIEHIKQYKVLYL